MNKSTILKITDVIGLVTGCVCLYLSGIGENMVTAIVAGVFVLAGTIAAVFG
jgi:hypothetical protein